MVLGRSLAGAAPLDREGSPGRRRNGMKIKIRTKISIFSKTTRRTDLIPKTEMSALARRRRWPTRISFIPGRPDEISDQMDFSPQNLDFLENDASDRPKPKNRNVRVGTAQKMAKTDFFYFRTHGRKTRKIDFLEICASDRPNFCGISNPGPPPPHPQRILFYSPSIARSSL